MQINPEIKWYDISDMNIEDFDNINLPRYNIKNYSTKDNYKMNNFYVFPVIDNDTASKTGFYAMCINKEFAQKVKQNLESWQHTRK